MTNFLIIFSVCKRLKIFLLMNPKRMEYLRAMIEVSLILDWKLLKYRVKKQLEKSLEICKYQIKDYRIIIHTISLWLILRLNSSILRYPMKNIRNFYLIKKLKYWYARVSILSIFYNLMKRWSIFSSFRLKKIFPCPK